MLKESELKVLDYLSLSQEGEGFISQIARNIGLSKGEVSKSVKTLKQCGFVRSRMSGRNMICSVNRSSQAIISLRIAFNILEIMPQVAPLRKFSQKIAVFGSCAQGTDTVDSDIDILVIAADKGKINSMTQKVKLSRAVQWVIKTPQEYVILVNREKVFAEEINRGILLYEVDDENSCI
jgi:predicted nucleotidyltransferase/biotin operon repressor